MPDIRDAGVVAVVAAAGARDGPRKARCVRMAARGVSPVSRVGRSSTRALSRSTSRASPSPVAWTARWLPMRSAARAAKTAATADTADTPAGIPVTTGAAVSSPRLGVRHLGRHLPRRDRLHRRAGPPRPRPQHRHHLRRRVPLVGRRVWPTGSVVRRVPPLDSTPRRFWLSGVAPRRGIRRPAGAHARLRAAVHARPTLRLLLLPPSPEPPLRWITAATVLSLNSFAAVAGASPRTKITTARASAWVSLAAGTTVTVTSGDPVYALTLAWALRRWRRWRESSHGDYRAPSRLANASRDARGRRDRSSPSRRSSRSRRCSEREERRGGGATIRVEIEAGTERRFA